MVGNKWSSPAVGPSRDSRLAAWATGGGVQRAPLHIRGRVQLVQQGGQGGDCSEGRGSGGQ